MACFSVCSNEQLEVQIDKPRHCCDFKELWEAESPHLSLPLVLSDAVFASCLLKTLFNENRTDLKMLALKSLEYLGLLAHAGHRRNAF